MSQQKPSELQDETTPHTPPSPCTIGPLVEAIAIDLEQCPQGDFDTDSLEILCDNFTKLHAQLRIKHASLFIKDTRFEKEIVPPEQARQWKKLHGEYMPVMGMIDRMLRSAESVMDRDASDAELLFLRMCEIVAMMRRHLAEEDYLVCRANWDDIGGES
ncbi:MAG: hypothetical protein ACYTHJ_09830 [Planctomycetota bacterium]|jgi:hypothetical protein